MGNIEAGKLFSDILEAINQARADRAPVRAIRIGYEEIQALELYLWPGGYPAIEPDKRLAGLEILERNGRGFELIYGH